MKSRELMKVCEINEKINWSKSASGASDFEANSSINDVIDWINSLDSKGNVTARLDGSDTSFDKVIKELPNISTGDNVGIDFAVNGNGVASVQSLKGDLFFITADKGYN